MVTSDVRECAEKVAEYLVLARSLRETSSQEDYNRANRLSWELGMWLPETAYKDLGQALANPNDWINVLSIVISVRKELLQVSAGNLTQNDILVHAPGIGKQNNIPSSEDGSGFVVEVEQLGGFDG